MRDDETFRRAIAAWKAGDLERARAGFTDPLASERAARMLFIRGRIAAELRDAKAAVADFDAALALEPGPARELELCEVASDEEAVRDALGDRGLAACERAVAGNPQAPRAYFEGAGCTPLGASTRPPCGISIARSSSGRAATSSAARSAPGC